MRVELPHTRNKKFKYRSSLRKLIRKLRIFFTNENVCKKSKALVAFLSNQKIGGQLGLLPHSFFSQNLPINLQLINMQILFDYLCAESQDQNIALIPKTSRN